MHIQSNGLRLRYINAQFYELVLPNGKHMIFDPYVTPENLSKFGYRDFSVEEIERADYIVLTHAHFDHTADLGTLCKKFGSKVFAGSMSIMKIAEFYDLDHSTLFPLEHMQTLELEDFTLTAIRGKHVGANAMRERMLHLTEKKFGVEGHGELDVLGSVDTYDFCLTLQNNLRLMAVSGDDVIQNVYRVAAEFRPNVLIRHAYGKWAPERYADILERFGAQVAFPSHQDSIMSGRHTITVDEFMNRTERALQDRRSHVMFINPEPYKWYDVAMTASAADD